MFGGHTIVLVPVCGLTKPQSAVFAKRIASLGGIVVEVTKKGSYKAAISDATEIVSGPDLSDPLPSILPALGLSSPADIPSTTKVVSLEWLVQSLAASALLPSSAFEFSPAAIAAPAATTKYTGPLFALIDTTTKDTIGGICSSLKVPFLSGQGYYEVAKSESASAGKSLVLYDTVANTVLLDGDVKAKLGLPTGSELKLSKSTAPPGTRLFVQSTSGNRQIAVGTSILMPIRDGTVMSSFDASVRVIPGGVSRSTPTPASPAKPAASLKRVAAAPVAPPAPVDSEDEDEPVVVVKKAKAAPAKTAAAAAGGAGAASFFTASTPAAKPMTFTAPSSTTNIVEVPPEDITSDPITPSWTWQNNADSSLYWLSTPGVSPSSLIAAFDVDGTLTETNSGGTFAANASDWHWLFPVIPAKLKQLHDDGYKVVIMSNQKGVQSGKTKLSDVTGRFEQIARSAAIPMQMIFATGDSFYRKPCIGMWHQLATKLNGGVAIDMTKSFYIGDAAARPASAGRKKDFSGGDLKFALNLGLPFQTPEQLFLGSKERLHCDRSMAVLGTHPSSFRPKAGAKWRLDGSDEPLAKSGVVEVVLLVGPPACGKSTITSVHFPAYSRVNQDILKTRRKCLDVARAEVSAGKSVVIDSTNKDVATRREWVDLASSLGVPIRCVYVDIPKELSMHMNTFRGSNPKSLDPRSVPDMIIHMFYKNVQKPTVSEGFTEVIPIRTLPQHFNSKLEEQMFFSYVEP